MAALGETLQCLQLMKSIQDVLFSLSLQWNFSSLVRSLETPDG